MRGRPKMRWNSRLQKWEPKKGISGWKAKVQGWHAGQYEGKAPGRVAIEVGTNVSNQQGIGDRTPESMRAADPKTLRMGGNGKLCKSINGLP